MLSEYDYKKLCLYTISYYSELKEKDGKVIYQNDPEIDSPIFVYPTYEELFRKLLLDNFLENIIEEGILEDFYDIRQ